MSIKVKFDRILGRLREKDGDGGSPAPPLVPKITVETIGSNKTFYADMQQSDTLTVVVKIWFNGHLVDADSNNGWTKTATGTYQRTLTEPGEIARTQWRYTPGGDYGSSTATGYSEARSLTRVYPAYWGIYPDNDASGNISAIVAALNDQHRVTQDLNTTIEVPNQTANDCWLWIVTHNKATATPEAFDVTMLRDPVTGKTFASPMSGTDWNLSGYKAYVSINPADAGLSFGNVKLTINL